MNDDLKFLITTVLPQPMLIMMCGAKGFVYSNEQSFVQFQLPSNFAAQGINRVKITYNIGQDLWELDFLKVTGPTRCKLIKHFDGVYSEDMRQLFTDTTGLILQKPRMARG